MRLGLAANGDEVKSHERDFREFVAKTVGWRRVCRESFSAASKPAHGRGDRHRATGRLEHLAWRPRGPAHRSEQHELVGVGRFLGDQAARLLVTFDRQLVELGQDFGVRLDQIEKFLAR